MGKRSRVLENNRNKKISIIIPVYNVEMYLEKCMQSILNQTYSNLEIILINDGSKDASGEICEKIAKKDNRVCVIHKENGGASSARNKGLEVATGDYIGFVDADDYITKDMYQYLYDLLTDNDADIAMCDFTRDSSKLDENIQDGQLKYYETAEEIQDFFYRVNGEPSCYSIWNRLFKKEVLQDVRFIEGKITEDVLFTYDVYKNTKKIVSSNLRKYLYVKNESGVTRSKLCKKDMALFDIWDEIVNRESGTAYFGWAVLNRKRATFTLYVKGLMHGEDGSIEKHIIKQWKIELKENYRELSNSGMLDWKRKFILFIICKMF